MKRMISIFAISMLLVSCGNNTKQENNASDNTNTPNAVSDEKAETGSDQMHIMHDAMGNMMKEMHAMKFSGDPDYDYAMIMKRHHQGSIEMAKAEIEGGSSLKLKDFLEKMIDDQQAEIEKLDRFIQGKTPSGNSNYGQRAMEMMTPMGSIKMDGTSLDAMFASMIIPHHRDAIRMSQEYLKVGKSDELKKIATGITEQQTKEIEELQHWQH